MAKHCGIISLGGLTGGGHIIGSEEDPATGATTITSTIPIAEELVDFHIGETFFPKIRLCQQMVSQFIHPGDDACIYVYKQGGITNVIVGVKSSKYPSYSISTNRLLLMLFAQYFFGFICYGVPAWIVLRTFNWELATPGFYLAGLALPSYGAWTLMQAYREMKADFG